MKKLSFKSIIILFSIINFILILLNLAIGQINMSLMELIQGIFTNHNPLNQYVILNLRLPRVLIVLFSGIALAMAGALLQTISKNDLADPGIIGINSGAGLGVTIFFLLFVFNAKSFAYLLPFIAFMGGLVSALLIFVLSYHKNKGIHPYKMILLGVGFSMAASGLMVLLITSAERDQVQFITNWLAGNVWGGDWPYVWVTLPLIVLSVIYIGFQSQTLNIIHLGENHAKGLGVNMKRKQFTYLLIATILASVSVAVVGNIAFIGLLSPHIAKQLVGIRHQKFLPVAGLIGANIMLASDLLARNLIQPNGLPTGILVAFIGTPYFIYLILKK
ncbi:iron ABC transporter permease [Hujiaoplasma nucleasis]|uniref:Iron ABC transporter permease n=1 Tax=Hujiaoplasma nucleasis TaxID=2725268 RepID=A0A7L6N3S3_9MOLU|nr:iron ABC transporter permease [Hujiaoplasma nucleasis]QLY39868.1 iron ABC transporter permease [Hujiaoplasma nucleasis]